MKEKAVNSINTSIFESFSKLTNEDNVVRLKGAVNLVKQFENSAGEKSEKQFDYALKRLIRGCGSSSTSSRIGFYTTLSGMLNESSKLPDIPKILEILNKELHGSADEKAKLDTQVGTILVCGATIRSKVFEDATGDDVENLTKHLMQCLKKPAVYSLACTFLNEIIGRVSTKIFLENVFPKLKEVLSISKNKNSLDTIYITLLIEKHHENNEIPKKFWKSKSILSADHYGFLVNLMWNVKSVNVLNHPFYEFLAKELIQQKQLKEFWQHVETFLSGSTKFMEIVTIHFAIAVLKNLSETPGDVLTILTGNLLKILVENSKKTVSNSEDLQDMYDEFYELLNEILLKIEKDDVKLSVLNVLIQSPGTILLERNLSKKIITNLVNSLELKGLTKSMDQLKSIVTNGEDFRERLYAANLLQRQISNKLVIQDLDFRFQQLQFFVNFGIFKTNNGKDLVEDSEWDKAIAKEVTPNIRNLLYHSLEHKLPKLEDEKTLLLKLVEFIDKIVSKKNSNKYLVNPLKDSHLLVWNKMLTEVRKSSSKKNKKQNLVFHILLLHMGLQLFVNPDVAENAINELESVLKRVSSKEKAKNANNEEPEWIEVVIDLFLNLLSQNSHVLRNVIRHIYPQLCDEITLTAFNQILEVLDLKNEENPLTAQENGNEEDEDEEEEEDEDEKEDDDEEVAEEESSEDDADDDGDDEELEETEDEDAEKVTDKLRMAVQAALGAHQESDDMDMDIDQIDEAEGARLNEALSNAFKLLKQSKKSKKKSKADKIADETLLHFRMRVLDLMDLYLKHNPKMLMCLEIIMFIFQLLPIAIKETKHEPILNRFNLIFDKLVQTKSFSKETAADVTQKNISEIITNLLDKSTKEQVFPQRVSYLNKACVFLINCSNVLEKLELGESTQVLEVFKTHLEEFLQHRNPTLQLNTYQMIFGCLWSGNFQLADLLAKKGLNTETRSLRRTQSLQLLKIFYKNYRLLTMNLQETKKCLLTIEKCLEKYVKSVEQVSINEFHELLQLLLAVRHFHQQQKNESQINWTDLDESLQKMRKQHLLKINVFDSHKKVCQLTGAAPIKNEKVAKLLKKQTKTVENGTTTGTKLTNGNDAETETTTDRQQLKRKKNSNKKEKKLKKQRRLELASKGFSEGFTFTGATEIVD